MVILQSYLESQLLKDHAYINQLICSGNVKINNDVIKKPDFILSTSDIIEFLNAGQFSGCTITYKYKEAKGKNSIFYPR